ncbi:MAG TPA: NAD(P)-dependent oxidoreductase [Flavobacteriaceae bacterium]|nr:NAD(P)-dependent oxidoreductase [Flavobacteriaceae bacterium]
MNKTFALITERKNPPDKRVVLTPSLCIEFQKRYPDAKLLIEKSDVRVFKDQEYIDAGFEVVEDVHQADVLIGVKEVPVEALIPNKTYMFFSHTFKEQPYNRKLLQAILKNNIELIDHETLIKSNNVRLVGFGRYAGIVGAYNGIRMYGKKEKLFSISKVENLRDLDAVKVELEKVDLPPIKIVVTGIGKAGKGAKEVLNHLKIRNVTIPEFLNKTFHEPVYCSLEPIDYVKRKDGSKKEKQDFYTTPELFENDFMRFAKVSDIFIAGHFYGEGAPKLLSKEDLKHPELKIRYIADVSCDIDGPIASTIRPSTIADPFYGYLVGEEKEVAYDHPDAIAVMAVDNLPCELPRNASEGFGKDFLNLVIPSFFNKDKSEVLKRARMTDKQGNLTPRFSYLSDYVKGK